MFEIGFNKDQNCYENGKVGLLSDSNGLFFVSLGIEKQKSHLLENFFENIPIFEGMEFAYILLNSRTNTVTFATDFYGKTPLFYCILHSSIIISTNFNTIVGKLEKIKVNNKFIEFYLNRNGLHRLGFEDTIVENIFKVLPANILVFENNTLKKQCYWKPNSYSVNNSQNFNKLAQSFYKVFETSIKAKLGNYTKIGANLSGGLDSSSIVSVLGKQKHIINTYYWNTNTNSTEESKYANLVVDKWATNHHIIKTETKDLIEELICITKITGQPNAHFFPPSNLLKMAELAEKENIEILFSGEGGDDVVGLGYEYLKELILGEKWSELKEAILDLSKYFLEKKLSFYYSENIIENVSLRIFIPILKKHLRNRKIVNASILIFKMFELKLLTFKTFLKLLKKYKIINNNGNNENLNENLDLIPKVRFENEYQNELFYSGFEAICKMGFEATFAIFGYYNLRISYPFYDKHLFELSVQIPPEMRFDKGRLRGTLRHAMKGILPIEIESRVSKAEFTDVSYFATIALTKQYKLNQKDTHLVWEYFDQDLFQNYMRDLMDEKIENNKKRLQIWTINRVISLAVWLDINQEKIIPCV